MHVGRLYGLLAALALLGPAHAVRALSADLTVESLVVETKRGRVYTGHVDPTTTRTALAVRIGGSGMYLVRRVSWQDVALVRLDGRETSVSDLMRRLDEQGWPSLVEELPAPDDSRAEKPAVYTGQAAAPTPIVRSISVEAVLGKWTSGAEDDGILLRVYPLDSDGNVVPASGTLDVDVIGQRGYNRRGTPVFPRLVRWSTRVNPQDFGARGAVYRVPFQALHPEFNLELSDLGTVHARLSVPGHGVFDDTVSTMRLRPLSPSRDYLQQYTGDRFFPEERTNRGTNDSGYPH
jgi:hypothetical protein